MLGFDFGTRRIGVAVGETITSSARPLATLRIAAADAPPWPEIADLIAEWRPDRLVVGLPRHLDGRESAFTRHARRFAAELGCRHDRPVSLWDEALSTEAAREALAAKRRAGGRRTDRDALNAEAAREILHSWLLAHAGAQRPQ